MTTGNVAGIKNDSRNKINDMKSLVIFTVIVAAFFAALVTKMGVANLFSTMMKTAYDLLMSTSFYILAVAVIAGAMGRVASEFEFLKILDKIFSPMMKPLYGLPGASFLGATVSYISDNPAICPLMKDRKFSSYFRKHQVPCLTILGTTAGMGLIVTTFVIGQGFVKEAVVGNIAAFLGCAVGIRVMMIKTKKALGTDFVNPEDFMDEADIENEKKAEENPAANEQKKSFAMRFLDAGVKGGQYGVELGISLIAAVLVICTFIMLLTKGVADPSLGYQGLPYEGIGLIPWLGKLAAPVLKPLFGFSNPEAIAFPVTALGSVGASLGLIPEFIKSGIIVSRDVAVYTAIGITFAGFLCTHVAMMESFKSEKFVGLAINIQLLAGVTAGIIANILMMIF